MVHDYQLSHPKVHRRGSETTVGGATCNKTFHVHLLLLFLVKVWCTVENANSVHKVEMCGEERYGISMAASEV